VRNELLLEELTMAIEAPDTLHRSSWWLGVFRGTVPSYFVDQGPRSTSCHDPCGPSSDYHRRWRSSPPQGQTRGWQLHPWRFHRPGWWPGLAVFLEALDRNHLHVLGPVPSASRPPVLALLTAPPTTHLRCLPMACLHMTCPRGPRIHLSSHLRDPHHDSLVPAR
jgi:hypothetical protein